MKRKGSAGIDRETLNEYEEKEGELTRDFVRGRRGDIGVTLVRHPACHVHDARAIG